jgi:flagellin-like hook-associated protein FlgL
MLVPYSYTDGGGTTQNASVFITGAGPEHSVILEPSAEATSFYFANAEFPAGGAGPFDFAAILAYDRNQPVSAANPMPVTYTYLDDSGARQYHTIFVADINSRSNLEPAGADDAGNPVYNNQLSFSLGSNFAMNDSFNLTLEQYAGGQTYSQKLLEELAAAQGNLLQYTGDAGAKLNNIEVRLNFMGDDVIRVDDRLKALEDLDIAAATTRYATLQTMYELGLLGASTMFKVSLADYL